MRDLLQLNSEFSLEVVYLDQKGTFVAKLRRGFYSAARDVVQEKIMNATWTDEQITTLMESRVVGSGMCRSGLACAFIKRVRDEQKAC